MAGLKEFVAAALKDLRSVLAEASDADIVRISFDVAVDDALQVDARTNGPALCRLQFSIPLLVNSTSPEPEPPSTAGTA